ncbi:transcription repressor OFP14 [Lycium ferocissimum]|uniref:transcription repressor OFP14 n=1 Tax=Lycium ferocissimum TaxID=112874 RepID=UPI0028155BBE|nr:transcription repressor OFP14 [Lycium ferocissimum]
MPKQLQKSLSDYLSKRKNKPTPQLQPSNSSSKTLSSSTSWLLRGCRHPKTPSFSAVDRKDKHAQGKDDAATLTDIDHFLFENFKSFYSKDEDTEIEAKTSNESNNNSIIVKKGKKEDILAPKNEENVGGSNSLSESPRYVIPPSNLRCSRRFFMARGSSSSLIEEARTSMTVSDDTGSTSAITTTTTNTVSNESSAISTDCSKETTNADDFITVVTYSPSPYDDFRQSMQEMMEARLNDRGKINWEFMEELLFCYLNLNDKKSYKYILNAFVDQIVVLRENSGRVPVISRNVRALDLAGELNQGNT